MNIFKNYTGNTLLNNALMTIEALGKFNNVSEITTESLIRLYKEKNLLKLNKRLKNYTMIFSKNGPLHNDKVKGEKVYEALFKTIIENFENDGENICEISGLRFNVPFNRIYEIALKKAGLSDKEIEKKDTNLSRIWFPLIGGLGSDAQALPQAKFTIRIHPICIAILQFLPLSSLLYKGGILLIDSSNFDFSKEFISRNYEELNKRIQNIKSSESIENVKDFSKGNYVLKAIELLQEIEDFHEVYTDLNLWSFSNSGTGASCEIDRVPNDLLKKLISFKESNLGAELNKILNNPKISNSFLKSLENNTEWFFLYPNDFGAGKKKVEYEGVSIEFLEKYFEVTNNTKQIKYAKYVAYLIEKYKTNYFDKYLSKKDAWDEESYRIDLFAVLVEASENSEWSLMNHLDILDNPQELPIRNTFYKLHKVIHFYYRKKVWSVQLPKPSLTVSNARIASKWMISIIEKDVRRNNVSTDIINAREYFSFSDLLIRGYKLNDVHLHIIRNVLYDKNFRPKSFGLRELLRIFYSQPLQDENDLVDEHTLNELFVTDKNTVLWFNSIEEFSEDYQAYYYSKYRNPETGSKPINKFISLIQNISLDSSRFLRWFYMAIENANDFLRNEKGKGYEKWTSDLLRDYKGDLSLPFAKLSIKLTLLKKTL